jgi:hypothetical protein
MNEQIKVVSVNEQIKEFAREAGHVYVGGNTVPYYQFSNNQLEKFAQLIVRECADIADFCDQEESVEPVSSVLKRHFGIEEKNT